ncbi:MAG TPA: VOC family protein, partial [Candidatus Binataceae bacterium]|nr:VOC family protein [Candidatus Binataceae bacterium]
MILGIDHIVIAVNDLDTAMADYSQLGFTVVRGGRHSGLNTHNALIAFGDGCYLELIASLGSFHGPADWWFEALKRGGGLTDFCVQSDNLDNDAAAFRQAGVKMGEPFSMSRERPDGYTISWQLALNESETRGLVPFFIRDLTPRDERVPANRTHPNGAAGVKALTLVVADLNRIGSVYEKALERRGEPVTRDDLQSDGVGFALGPHEIQLIEPRNTSGVAAERIHLRGASPVEL